MEIVNIKVGILECNCYILKENNQILIIDPGSDFEKINKHIKDDEILGVLITHNHFDHIGALNEIKKTYNPQILTYNNLEEKKYNLGPFSFEVIYTKGHSEDSITFYFEKENIMFVGDFIFKEDIGRCDLETGNYKEMLKSINKIKKYQKNIEIYPGHGEKTNLEHEKEKNIYFKK